MVVRTKISAPATKSLWSLIPGRGWRFLSAPKHPTCSVAHPASSSMGTGVLTLGIGHELDHLLPFSAAVKN